MANDFAQSFYRLIPENMRINCNNKTKRKIPNSIYNVNHNVNPIPSTLM